MSERDVAAVLTQADEALRAGDVQGALARLRPVAEQAPLAEVARIVEQAAITTGFDDMAQAAAAVVANDQDPQALYDFGYAAIERGISYLAVPALVAAMRAAPGSLEVLAELVVALEDESRHLEAVRWLEEHEPLLPMWPHRYVLAFNSVMAGDVPPAQRYVAALQEPDDEGWRDAYHRVRLMVARIEAVRGASPLDGEDLRGWHFAINGAMLGTMSPHGFHEGMRGRYAFLQDTYASCRHGLERLRLVLAAADRRPEAVSLLPDRSSHILGLAAAEVLGLPARPWEPGSTNTVVVAYDLWDVGTEVGPTLRQRAGNVLVEHATCWTTPPPVAADYTTLLVQRVVPPWGERLMANLDGDGPAYSDPDDRSPEELANEILTADVASGLGDDTAPRDSDDDLAGFVGAVRQWWPPATDHRDRLWSPGPVPSNRFL